MNLSLVVGIFPYVLKLLQSPAGEVRQLLVSIWASIIGFDRSCRQELVRDKMQGYFIQYLVAKEKDMPAAQRCMAAFVLAEICNGYSDGQQSCLQQGLHRSCAAMLNALTIEPLFGPASGGSAGNAPYGSPSPFASTTPALPAAHPSASASSLKQWLCLCLYKLCEDFNWAKYLIITEMTHIQVYPLLVDSDVLVRAAAVLALGELFGASALAPAADLSTGRPPALTRAPSAGSMGAGGGHLGSGHVSQTMFPPPSPVGTAGPATGFRHAPFAAQPPPQAPLTPQAPQAPQPSHSTNANAAALLMKQGAGSYSSAGSGHSLASPLFYGDATNPRVFSSGELTLSTAPTDGRDIFNPSRSSSDLANTDDRYVPI